MLHWHHELSYDSSDNEDNACINLATLDLEYKTKKEEQMTFKRSK